jgi:hypothetical protein
MTAAITPTKTRSAGSTIQESMPTSWDFEIYEDTPEEEASNLMEHSTQSLNLSFDEEIAKAERDDRGKENEAPEGYDAPTASRQAMSANMPALPAPTRVKKTDLVRRKVTEMDDGERSPLSDLDTDEFVPEGLTRDAHVVVDALPEKVKLDVNSLFAVPPPTCAPASARNEDGKASKLSISSTISEQADIAIWEDNADAKIDESASETTRTEKEETVENNLTLELEVVA